MGLSEGFPPLARRDARVLLLGSLPGQASIAARQYYAHPRNAFWPIMQELFDINGCYADRCAQLKNRGIAVWDVLAASVRPGSLDASIETDTATVNDFAKFLTEHPDIKLIAFNGKTAERLFTRLVPIETNSHLRLAGLPSSSPAYAAMPLSGKLERWREHLVAAAAQEIT